MSALHGRLRPKTPKKSVHATALRAPRPADAAVAAATDPTAPEDWQALLREVRACTLCAAHLPLGPRPVLQLHPQARILIASQAPGRKVHESGVPFDDASGDRLRDWMGITREQFYDARRIAIVPMGLCYPGPGPHGDLPPRPECAPKWRERLLGQLKNLELTLVIGQYAHAWHLGERRVSVTDAVRGWRDHWPALLPLPHPSGRNNIWLRRNPWFEAELLPALRRRVAQALAGRDRPRRRAGRIARAPSPGERRHG
ncbi:MAG: uracil-DNA glycosylase family protein [Proteobacteria bacterium]|nr:uracil-DNA glycosylase family protein [Pseudomonadota bacterium]